MNTNFLFDIMTSAFICPMAVFYMFILSNQWEIGNSARVLFMLFTAGGSLLVTQFLPPPMPLPLRILLCWAVVFGASLFFSRIKGSRFLFLFCSCVLFTYMNTAFSSALAVELGVHRFVIRVLLDGLGLFFTSYFFTPVFQGVFLTIREGWWFMSLIPLSMIPAYIAALLRNYTNPFQSLESRIVIYSLSLFSVVVYTGFFYFFVILENRQKDMVSNDVLREQFMALQEQEKRKAASQWNQRILRHDLRHYLRLLNICLQANDTEQCRAIISAMRGLLKKIPEGQEDQNHDDE